MRSCHVTTLVTLTALVLLGRTALPCMAATSEEIEQRVHGWMPKAVDVGSEVFQYAATFDAGNDRQATSYLWIPPDAETIRGLIIGGDLMAENNLVVDPIIRDACADQAIGILFTMPGLPLSLKADDMTGGETFVKVLTQLAAKSNHPELLTAPLMPIGHSAASPMMARILMWNPDRCFAALTYKGAHPMPTSGPTERVRGIPGIHIQDFVEEYKNRRETGSLGRVNVMAVRAVDPQLLVGIIEDNGSKHAAWCFRLTPLIAEFIRASAALRIGEDGKVKPVPIEAGVLVDKELAAPRYPMAPADAYTGDPKEALWFPSAKLGTMVTEYNAVQLAKEAQYVAFLNPGSDAPLPEKTAPHPKFVGPDVFEVKATFLEKSNNAALPQDPVTHGPGPILFAPHGRTLELVAPGRFRFRYHPQMVRWYRISAFEMGDIEHRFEEVLVDLHVGPPGRGAEQTIEFPEIGGVKRAAFPVILKASSSAGLPVRYVVEYGPAVIESDNVLTLAEVPKCATFPMEIRVTAYQYGSHIEPVTRAAQRVSRIVTVE